jgi:hypothetical protein
MHIRITSDGPSGHPCQRPARGVCRAKLDSSIAALAFFLFSWLAPSVAVATGGISGSKLATPEAATVPANRMEFEPYFSLAYNQDELDQHWRVSKLMGQHQGFETGFRFTTGIADNLEAGLVVPMVFEKEWGDGQTLEGSGLGDIPVGAKWRFLVRETWALAWHGGVTLPTGHTRTGPSQLPTGGAATVAETGIVATVEPASNFSVDASLQTGLAFSADASGEDSWEVAFDLAAGYSLGAFLLVLELNQSHAFWDGHLASLVSTNLGFTWELNDSVIIVTGPRFDLVGKSATRAIAYNLAFTILL